MEIQGLGRMTVNKLQPKFRGHFRVTEVWSNELTYVITRTNDAGKCEDVRAHQKQLRKFRAPLEYLLEHSMYEICQREDNGETASENFDDEMNRLLDGKELLILSKTRKKEHSK